MVNLLIGIATVFGIICVVAVVLSLCFMIFDKFDATDFTMKTTVISFAVCCFCGLILLVIDLIGPSAEKFELVVKEWNCTESHIETYTTMIMVGKVMVPQIHTRNVCDNFHRAR